MPDRLQKVSVPIVDCGTCGGDMLEPLPKAIICAGSFEDGGKDACKGDSSGPLFSDNGTVVGIVMEGEGCAKPERPGMYVNVAAVLGFICEHL